MGQARILRYRTAQPSGLAWMSLSCSNSASRNSSPRSDVVRRTIHRRHRLHRPLQGESRLEASAWSPKVLDEFFQGDNRRRCSTPSPATRPSYRRKRGTPPRRITSSWPTSTHTSSARPASSPRICCCPKRPTRSFLVSRVRGLSPRNSRELRTYTRESNSALSAGLAGDGRWGPRGSAHAVQRISVLRSCHLVVLRDPLPIVRPVHEIAMANRISNC